METVQSIIKKISDTHTQVSSSQKDEIKVMKALINDKSYVVDVYGKNGVEGTLCPAQEARDLASSVIATTTKISSAEASALADNYEFRNAEAVNMINISKEFINTYLQTGRKLPLGGRAKSDIAIAKKEVAGGVKNYPKKVGVDENGKAVIEIKQTEPIPAYESIKVFAP